jgi:salicylate hydroxylase
MENRLHRGPSCRATTVCAILSATVGTPSILVPPPCGFGISTARTGGGKYVPEGSHHSVSRITLRQVLLDGLDAVVHPGKEFTHYEQGPGGRVTAFFADGTTATGDVLVGADGADSRVRQQYLPDAHRMDTGVVAVAGKLPLTQATRSWLPERLSGSVNNIMPPRDSFMFTAVWEGDQQRLAINDPGMPPGLLFDNTQDYVFWAYAAKRTTYPAEPAGDGARLRDMITSMISGWHPGLLRLVGESDPATVAPVIIRAMAPVRPRPASHITLLGDAIHNMTPMAGIGANTALRDARLLASKLAHARPESDEGCRVAGRVRGPTPVSVSRPERGPSHSPMAAGSCTSTCLSR